MDVFLPERFLQALALGDVGGDTAKDSLALNYNDGALDLMLED